MYMQVYVHIIYVQCNVYFIQCNGRYISLERFFGCQRQRGGVHDNPNAQESMKNTQALRVIKSVSEAPKRGNCRGGTTDTDKENVDEPLPKRRRTIKGN